MGEHILKNDLNFKKDLRLVHNQFHAAISLNFNHHCSLVVHDNFAVFLH